MSDRSLNTAPWEESLSALSATGSTPSVEGAPAVESETVPPEKASLINEIASEFVGFWNRLISRTNWEKGKVICSWRGKLIEAGLPRSVYSDEAIAQRIGGISGQHVGRLRRVYEKFGKENASGDNDRCQKLFWSHFQAALDWEDAERWLDRAAAEGFSVAQMRIARWEEYGAPADKKPKDSDIVAAEPDEDVNPRNDSSTEHLRMLPIALSEEKEKGDGTSASKEISEDEEPQALALLPSKGSDEPWDSPAGSTGEILRAMGDFPKLPADLAEPIEALKDAILNRKVSGWSGVSQDDLMIWLGALRGLTLARE